jgi:hypothetical protein
MLTELDRSRKYGIDNSKTTTTPGEIPRSRQSSRAERVPNPSMPHLGRGHNPVLIVINYVLFGQLRIEFLRDLSRLESTKDNEALLTSRVAG